ncbi:MAG: DUF2975 domain-containing protein [Clostridiaceae bacterium]
MNNKLDKFSKKINRDSIIIYLAIFIMIGVMVSPIINIINYVGKDPVNFEVKIAKEKGFDGSYCLYIDGKNFKLVDYNDYNKLDRNGYKNVKMCLIIEEIGIATKAFMIIILFLIVYQIMRSIVKEEMPFTEKNVNRLRMVAIITILIAIIPGCLKIMITMLFFNNTNVHLSQTNILVVILGVLIGVVSEIFKYGYELKDDISSKN